MCSCVQNTTLDAATILPDNARSLVIGDLWFTVTRVEDRRFYLCTDLEPNTAVWFNHGSNSLGLLVGNPIKLDYSAAYLAL